MLPSQLAFLSVGEFVKVFLDHHQEIQPEKWKKPRVDELALYLHFLHVEVTGAEALAAIFPNYYSVTEITDHRSREAN